MQLLSEIVIASVGSIVVSRGSGDKKKKKIIKLIMSSVSRKLWQDEAGSTSIERNLTRKKARQERLQVTSSGGQGH